MLFFLFSFLSLVCLLLFLSFFCKAFHDSRCLFGCGCCLLMTWRAPTRRFRLHMCSSILICSGNIQCKPSLCTDSITGLSRYPWRKCWNRLRMRAVMRDFTLLHTWFIYWRVLLLFCYDLLIFSLLIVQLFLISHLLKIALLHHILVVQNGV